MPCFSRTVRFVILIAVAACGRGVRAPATASDACPVERRTPTTLRLDDGRAIYIEPMAFAQTRGSAIIAGEPIYVWPRPATGIPDTTHGLIGVTLAGERVHGLRKPDLRGFVTHVRVAPDGDDYRLVFAVTDSSSVGQYSEVALSYWSARTDGRTWSALEPLPMPGERVETQSASALVRVGDEWLLAAPFSAGRERYVAIFSRSGGKWRVDTLTTDGGAYVALTEIGGTPLLYVVYGLGISDVNSVWLYARVDGSWQARGRVIHAGRRGVHHPRVAAADSVRVLSWTRSDPSGQGTSAYASQISADGALGPEKLLARNVGFWNVVSGRTTRPAWSIGTSDATDSAAMTFIEWESARPIIRDVLSNPYTGTLLGASLGDAAAVGPVFDPSNKEETLVSGILRFVRRCHSAVHVAP